MKKYIQGVDVSTGKLFLRQKLATLIGPNNFGENLTIEYSSRGLLNQLQLWNEENRQGVIGAGWFFVQPFIARIGNGSRRDSFIWGSDKTTPLILKSETVNAATGGYILEFVTATHSLNKIIYETKPNAKGDTERWIITDANGTQYIYGGKTSAIDWGVRWVTDNIEAGTPAVWVGSSIVSENQSNYALIWHLSSKKNIYGQQINYDYFSVKQTVGNSDDVNAKNYTVMSYLQRIQVVGGESVILNYAAKQTWEYPAFRMLLNTDGVTIKSNAYQDRITTNYLQNLMLYNNQNQLQTIIQLTYDFLFQHLKLTAGDNLNAMQKRVLTALSYLTPDGIAIKPAKLFDYWGLDGNTANYNPFFSITNDNLLKLMNKDFVANYSYVDTRQKTHLYGALFGHLKKITTEKGASIWYSYREVADNYTLVPWNNEASQENSLSSTTSTSLQAPIHPLVYSNENTTAIPASTEPNPVSEKINKNPLALQSTVQKINKKPSDLYLTLIKEALLYGRNATKLIQKEDPLFIKTKKDLQKNAEKYGYRCQNVPGDGNCFYHACADQLDQILALQLSPNQKKQLAQCLRKLACDYIGQHREVFEKFITAAELKNQAQNNVWVEDTVITALCYALNVNLILVRSDSPEPIFKRLPQGVCTLILGYQVGLHYQSLHSIKNSEAEKNKQLLLPEKLNSSALYTLQLPTVLNYDTELKVKLKNLLPTYQTKVQINQALYDELKQSTLLLGEEHAIQTAIFESLAVMSLESEEQFKSKPNLPIALNKNQKIEHPATVNQATVNVQKTTSLLPNNTASVESQVYRSGTPNKASLKDNNWNNQWESRLDFANIPWPQNDRQNWTNPRPYWGTDNYVVIRWDSNSDNPDAQKQIALKIFEWLGRWIEVSIDDTLIFNVYDFDDFSIKLVTGNGQFALCRTNIAGNSDKGIIALFHRDLYLPGLWYASYFLNDPKDIFLITRSTNPCVDFQQLEIGLGSNIVAILNKLPALQSPQQLFLFSFIQHEWILYRVDSLFPQAVGMAVNNDDVVVLGAEKDNTYCWLYHFDITQPQQTAWQPKVNGQSIKHSFLQRNAEYIDEIGAGFILTPMGGGIFNIQIWIPADAKGDNPTNMRVGILSWDDNYQLHIQPMYYTTRIGKEKSAWEFKAANKPILWQQKLYGSVAASNLVNMIATADWGYLQRYVARYAGGGNTDKYNPGWVGDDNFTFLNSDAWSRLATLDTNVDINGDGNTYGYHFFQYNPYGISNEPNHPYWVRQEEVSNAMGSNTDWERILSIIDEVLTLVGFFFQGLMPFLPEADLVGEISAVAGSVIKALNYADEAVNGMVTNTLLQGILTSVVKSALSGRRDGISQGVRYLLIGRGNVSKYDRSDPDTYQEDYGQYQPSAFAKLWDKVNQCWTWQPLSDSRFTTLPDNVKKQVPWSETAYASCVVTLLGQDTYSYGNDFIPFSYVAIGTRNWNSTDPSVSYFRGIYFDQVAFFRNGQLLTLAELPTWEAQSPSFPNIENLPYIIYNYVDNSDQKQPTQTTPLMYVPWGGICAYQPVLNVSYVDPSGSGVLPFDWVWEEAASDPTSTTTDVHPTLGNAQGLLLTMTQDGQVSGNITDYVIEKFSIEDGYQTYYTHFQYMPTYAAYHSAGSVYYNQVRVARGEEDYKTSALNHGWQEYYFYNGGFNYKGSSINQVENQLPTDPTKLPFDPANGDDSFYSDNADYTNVANYFRLMTGKLYCSRTLLSQNSSDFVTGYEIARQQTFYKAFENNVYDEQGNVLGQQFTTGVLPTLKVNFVTTNQSTEQDIYKAYTNGLASLNHSYLFYDMESDDGQNKFYGQWLPSQKDADYYLLNPMNSNNKLRSGLYLGQLTYNYNFTPANPTTQIEGIYTQKIPGISRPVIQGNNPDYQQFFQTHNYQTTVQTLTWRHAHLTNSAHGFPLATDTWGQAGWEIVSSEVHTWKKFGTQNESCWHPAASYRWQGDPQGNPQTDSLDFPWSTPPAPGDQVWVQTSSITEVSPQGIVYETASHITTPSFVIWDNNQYQPLGSMTNAGHFSEQAFYLGFEAYENFSAWQFSKDNSPIDRNALSYSTLSYSGNRSVCLTANSSASTLYQISFCPTAISNRFKNQLSSGTLGRTSSVKPKIKTLTLDPQDQRDWLLTFIGLSQQNSGSFTVTIQVNSQEIISQTFSISSNQWQPYFIPLSKFVSNLVSKGISEIQNFSVNFTLAQDIFIDNLYFTPLSTATFKLNSYDTLTSSVIAHTSEAEHQFRIRELYDRRGYNLGQLHKGRQYDAASLALVASSYSREGNNQDNFDSLKPNSQLQITAGKNHETAGYYFDFRDNQNSWVGGNVKDRLLILQSGETATSSLAMLPTPCEYGFGIRAELKGYVNTGGFSLTGQSTFLDLPVSLEEGGFWGIYQSVDSAQANSLFTFAVDKNGNFTPQQTAAITNVNLISGNNDQAIAYQPPNYFVTCQSTVNHYYSIYNIFDTTSFCIFTTSKSLSSPVAAADGYVYFSDIDTALYAIDARNVTNQSTITQPAFQIAAVLNYNAISPFLILTSQDPPITSNNNSKVILALNASLQPGYSSSANALTFNGVDIYATINDTANVLNFDTYDDFTVEFYLKTAITDPLTILVKEGDQNRYPYKVELGKAKSGTGIIVGGARYDGDAEGYQHNPCTWSKTSINDNQCHHIAFVKSGNQLYLYIDGQLEDQQLDYTVGRTADIKNNPLLITSAAAATQIQFFELRIWNRGKSQQEIIQLMKNRLTGKEYGLVGYWPLNASQQDSSLTYSPDLSFFQQEMIITGTTTCSPVGQTLNLPNAVLVNYDSNNTNNYTTAAIYDNAGKIYMAVAEDGSVFALNYSTLYAFDTQLNFINSMTFGQPIAGYPVASNGAVYVAFMSGVLALFDYRLNKIVDIQVAKGITQPPVVHGDKVSIIGNDNTLYTYNRSGLLAAAPYPIKANQAISLFAYDDYFSTLGVMIDKNNVNRITLSTPNASLALDNYQVSGAWQGTTEYHYTLTGPNLSLDPITMNYAASDWIFTYTQPVLHFFADGQLLFAQPISTVPQANFTLTSYGPLSCSDIILIPDPILNVSYHDGIGKMRQIQMHAHASDASTSEVLNSNKNKSSSIHSLQTTNLTPAVILKENLYDTQGKRVAITPNVIKKNDATLLFSSSFIGQRDPELQPQGVWMGGEITGDICQWVDKTSFPGKDVNYAYSGSYYEADSLLRTITTSKPGVTFNKASDHAVTYFPGNLPNNIKTLAQSQLGLETNLATRYAVNAQSTSVGKLGQLARGKITTFSSQAIANITATADGSHFLMVGKNQKQGAQFISESGLASMQENTVFLPRYFSDNKNFYLKEQMNALQSHIYRSTPDEKNTFYFYDNYNRLRFTQNATQKEAQIVLYYLYDAMGRLTEMGYYSTAWDIKQFLQMTQSPVTMPPSLATPLRQIIYDQLSMPDVSPHYNNQGKIRQIINWNATIQNDSYQISCEKASKTIVTYTLNDSGRITKVTSQLENNLPVEVNYAYNNANIISLIVYPTQAQVSYKYTIQQKIATINYQSTTQSLVQTLASYTYNAQFAILTETLGINYPITRKYVYGNSLGQLTQITDIHASSSEPVYSENLNYTDTLNNQGQYQDNNIQMLQVSFGNNILSLNPNYQRNYTYDIFNRLIGEASSGQTWEYDANGNRTEGQYSYWDNTNQLKTMDSTNTNYEYTANGLVIKTPDGKNLTYDQLSQLPTQVTYNDVAGNFTLTPISLLNFGLMLDGSGQNVGFIQDSKNVLNLVGNQGFTIEFWINCPPKIGNTQHIIEKWGFNPDNYPYLIMINEDGTVGIKRVLNKQAQTILNGNINVADGKFHHIALVRSEFEIALYIDAKFNNKITSLISHCYNNAVVQIGGSLKGGDNFKGQLFELRMWNQAKSNIDQLMKSRPTGQELDLVGYWPLNNNLEDISVYQQKIQFTQTPLYLPLPTENKLANYALNLNAGIQNFATIEDTKGILNLSDNQAFTIEFWMSCPRALNYQQHIIEKWGFSPDYPYLVMLDTDGKIIGKRYQSAQVQSLIKGVTPLADNQFHHIALVKDAKSLYLYVDGILNASLDNDSVDVSNTDPLLIGGLTNTAFIGQLFELRLWNKAKSQQEIQSTKDSRLTLTGEENGLVGYWPLDHHLQDLANQQVMRYQSAVNFIYDNKGERLRKSLQVNGIDTKIDYVRGIGQKPLIEYVNAAPNYHYIYGPTGLIVMIDTNQQQHFVVKDHLGSTQVIYNDSTKSVDTYYIYDSFGNITESRPNRNLNIKYLYTGQEWDEELQVYNYHARIYDPTIGRFYQPDPAHQFASPYVYCGNNPINNTDPRGKMVTPESINNFRRAADGDALTGVARRLADGSIEIHLAIVKPRPPSDSEFLPDAPAPQERGSIINGNPLEPLEPHGGHITLFNAANPRQGGQSLYENVNKENARGFTVKRTSENTYTTPRDEDGNVTGWRSGGLNPEKELSPEEQAIVEAELERSNINSSDLHPMGNNPNDFPMGEAMAEGYPGENEIAPGLSMGL